MVCGGDIFSGNPVVDIWEENGFPMIDLMNKSDFDVCVLGNHEFDYGQDALAERMGQSEFDWICANVDMSESVIPQPQAYSTRTVGDLRITFLGLIETNGKADGSIPSTHPNKVEGIHFENAGNVVGDFADLKEAENADLLVALTHLGHNYEGGFGDFQMIQQFPWFDLVIGGHSSALIDTMVNNTPVVQAGKYLQFAGKIELEVKEAQIVSHYVEFIDLGNYHNSDLSIQNTVEGYNGEMATFLDGVIGYSNIEHERQQIGCFYTNALKEALDADISIQNYGGVRNGLNEGDITIREIYEIDPFNNRAMIYYMTGAEIREFFKATTAWYCYAGIEIERIVDEVYLYYPDGSEIGDYDILKLAINDYIPAVMDSYFPSDGEVKSFTTAEVLIDYLKNINSVVDYGDCDRYFRYQ